MKITIGSSFYDKGKNGDEFRRAFAQLWYYNTMAAQPKPERVIVISEGGSKPFCAEGVDTVNLTGDLGHCEDLVYGRKPHAHSSWSISMCAAALLAYDNETDFLYKEEDCLAFGPWVEQMYKDMGDGVMVFGAKHTSPPWMACSQSLFLVAHRFIPTFVVCYLAAGNDRDRHNLGEKKFETLEAKFGKDKIKRLSFGVDRERPIPWDAPVFYAQQFTQAELDEAKRRGLI